jgi:predicted nucleotidyltransferase component of viral defense system
MNLHHDKKLMSDTLRAVSQHLDIKLVFVEKDYWITLVLWYLAKSQFADNTVFKGGTSLSKGYNLIDRFSEDVDLAIINNRYKSGNEMKNSIRNVEKQITSEFNEIQTEGITSKGSRFRKSVFSYPTTEKNNADNKLIVEINSFANPFPFQLLTIKSFVYDFLFQTGNDIYIEIYQLEPFKVNILSKEQTLLEKLISLVRISFDENFIESISGKIRHFYDLYFLMKDSECVDYVYSVYFKNQFDSIMQHDKAMFDEPKGWQNKTLEESPLITNFTTIWKQLKGHYYTELSALAYRPIPDEKDISDTFRELVKRIK